jgi:hypothetical protein
VQGTKQLWLQAGEKIGVVSNERVVKYTSMMAEKKKQYENTLAGQSSISTMLKVTTAAAFLCVPGAAGLRLSKYQLMAANAAVAGLMVAAQPIYDTQNLSWKHRGENGLIAAAASLAVPLVVSSAVIGAKAAPAIVNASKKIINFSAQAGKVVVQSSKKVANSANSLYQGTKNFLRGTNTQYAQGNDISNAFKIEKHASKRVAGNEITKSLSIEQASKGTLKPTVTTTPGLVKGGAGEAIEAKVGKPILYRFEDNNTNIKISDLQPTHRINYSKRAFEKFVAQIKIEGIQNPIKYVEYNGKKYIVNGHHRFFAAIRTDISSIPAIEVKLPYKGYKTVDDLVFGL